MKVINTVIVALALAVPHALVTADELVISKNINALSFGTEDYSPDMHEALTISPIGFDHIVVVPPGYANPAEASTETANFGIGLQNVNFPASGDLVLRTGIHAP